jgi:transcription factor IIIB subunit 2
MQNAMHDLIQSLASMLSATGAASRAKSLFSQAMARGHFRWGRKARLIAAAALAIALRESQKPDSISDIAFLINEPTPAAVSRAFTTIQSLLGLPHLAQVGPAQHLPALHAHVHQLLRPSHTDRASPLPQELMTLLSALDPSSVLRTTAELSSLLSRLGPALHLNTLPTPPTACALLILAFEAEARIPLPHLAEFASLLSARFGLKNGVVMTRYKTLYDLVEEWAREVPWLEQYRSGSTRGTKSSKRLVVARGLKDVLQFQEEIHKKRLAALEKPNVVLDADTDGEEDHEMDVDDANPLHGGPSDPPRKKRRKLGTLDEASQFLLDPLSNPLPSDRKSSPQHFTTTTDAPPLMTYLLTASPTSLSLRGPPPTRLQLLCCARGGGDAGVADEELFDAGELEGFMRSPEEIEQMRHAGVFEWAREGEGDVDDRGAREVTKAEGWARRKRAAGTVRVDMDAFARVLSGGGGAFDDDGDLDRAFHDNHCDDNGDASPDQGTRLSDEGVEVVEDWRPSSPTSVTNGSGSGWDRYEQEC